MDDLNDFLGALFSKGTESPPRRTSEADGISAESQCFKDIASAAETTVDKHWHTTVDSLHDFFKDFKRRGSVVNRATAMIRHHDAFNAVVETFLCTLTGEDAFRQNWNIDQRF